MTKVTRRTLVAILTLLALGAAGFVASPYLRFEEITYIPAPGVVLYGYRDRWSASESAPIVGGIGEGMPFYGTEPDGTAYRALAPTNHRDSVWVILRADGSLQSVALVDDLTDLEGFYDQAGNLTRVERNGTQLENAERDPEMIDRLSPAALKWPWWTKLPGFREHLSP